MTIQRPRGTRDFLPEETEKRGRAKKAMQDVLERWGYQEVATPTFEHLELFTIKSGASVVEEIYSFTDKGGRDLALRPELTAPVMRMYVSELQNSPKPQRLWYFGNCFRYERPQRGRFREFWQMGAELIGGAKPDSEAEAIALADGMLKSVGVAGDIHVGYLGLIRSHSGQDRGGAPVLGHEDDRQEGALSSCRSPGGYRAEPSRPLGADRSEGADLPWIRLQRSSGSWGRSQRHRVRCRPGGRACGCRLRPSRSRLGPPGQGGRGRAAAGGIPGDGGSSGCLWSQLHHRL